jgi:3-oxoadipate enol-lactonase
MAQLARPGFSFHYELIESAAPRDTLFLHGNLAANLWWEPMLEHWPRSSGPGRLILAEWRGCGKSSAFEGPFDLPTLAADVNALLEHLGASPAAPANLVAHSTGGLIGLHAMAAAPELYHQALLLDPVSPEGVELGPEMIAAFAQMSHDRAFCAAVILGTIHGGNLSAGFRERIVDAAFGVSPRIWGEVPALIHQPPALDFSLLTHPTLVAHGELDQVLPIAASETLAKALPRGEFQVLLGRGHCPNVEDPASFSALARGFLR